MSPPVFEVCDPALDEDEWTPVPGAADARAAVLHVLRDYDPAEFDEGRPFEMLARCGPDGREETVTVRVIPIHFEVR